jgi:hypothetical protein
LWGVQVIKINMVYCPKCGYKNQDDAVHCVSCGANLAVSREMRPREYEDMCFGRRSGTPWGIIFGIIILLFGATTLIQQLYGIKIEFWPVFLVLVGILVIVGAVSRRR